MEKNNSKNKTIGKIGEDAAADYLSSNGYRIVERNFRAGRLGEIDIIAYDKDFLCFIEVKTRTGLNYGYPSEAVGYAKQMNLRRLAMAYARQRGIKETCFRFDVAEVWVDTKNESLVPVEINIIKNAF
jgi:putative endonuclease